MFKLYTVLALFFTPMLSKAQNIPKNDQGKFEYVEVVEVDSIDVDKLYSNAKIAIVEAFSSAKDVTQLNDDNAKTVIGRGTFPIVYKGIIGADIKKFVEFKLLIQCKDNRYKCSIYNLKYLQFPPIGPTTFDLEDKERLLKKAVTKKQYEQLMELTEAQLFLLVYSIKKSMASKSKATKDDW